MELTRQCHTCGLTKPYSLMVSDKNAGYKDNIRPLCRSCKNIKGKEYKAKARDQARLKNPDIMAPVASKKNTMSQTQLKSCGLTGYKGPRVRDPNEALPQQFNKMTGKFVPSRDLIPRIGLAVYS